jgi:hypothetical protein
MPGLVPGIHVFAFHQQDVDGRDISAFARVYNALCPAMTVHQYTLAFGSMYATSLVSVKVCTGR